MTRMRCPGCEGIGIVEREESFCLCSTCWGSCFVVDDGRGNLTPVPRGHNDLGRAITPAKPVLGAWGDD